VEWRNDPSPQAFDAFFQGSSIEETRHVVVVEGPDAAAFLQGQCSQDISGLAANEASWTLLLEPDGKLGFVLWILRRGPESFALVPARAGAEDVVARLTRFRLRVKVDFKVVPMAWKATWIGDAHSGTLHWSLVDETSSDGASVVDALTAWIGQVLPDDGIEGMVPNELGPWLEATASFTKGCYTGQELVARIDSRRAAPVSQLVWFRGEVDKPAGLELVDGDATAGVVLRSAWNAEASIVHGLARIKRRWLPDAGSTRVVDGVELLG
jgi:tRNA-modifying protein YgfZ